MSSITRSSKEFTRLYPYHPSREVNEQTDDETDEEVSQVENYGIPARLFSMPDLYALNRSTSFADFHALTLGARASSLYQEKRIKTFQTCYHPHLNSLWIKGYFSQFICSGHVEVYAPLTQKLIYQGDIRYTFMHGKGTLYHPKTNRMLYKGDFKKNCYSGWGQRYCEFSGQLEYQGEFSNNLRHGFGSLYDRTSGELIYQGLWKNGNMHGLGYKIDRTSGELKIGQFEIGRLHGEAKIFQTNKIGKIPQIFSSKEHAENFDLHSFCPDYALLIKEGQFSFGISHGFIREYYTNREFLYEGQVNYGSKQGYGCIYKTSTGQILYDGYFNKNQFNGLGIYYNSEDNHQFSIGYFKNGKLEGLTKIFRKKNHNDSIKIIQKINPETFNLVAFSPDDSILTFSGNFMNGMPNGFGCSYNIDEGTLVYEGEFKDGNFNGYGKIYYPDSYYVGNFVNNQSEGFGKLFTREFGSLIYEGEFLNSHFHGQGKQYDKLTGKILYEGAYKMNSPHGLGKRYSYRGIEPIVHEGFFKHGLPHGRGVLYKLKTRQVISHGYYYYGTLNRELRFLAPGIRRIRNRLRQMGRKMVRAKSSFAARSISKFNFILN